MNLTKIWSWSNVLSQQNPKIAFENFFEIFYSIRDLSFPEVKVKIKPTRFKHSPWMSKGLKISQKRKERLFSRKLRCPNKENVDKFQIYNKIYNKIRRAAKKLYYDKQFKKFTKDSKQTWSLIREVIGKKTDKHQIPKYFQSNGQIISDYLDIANEFNTFFASVGPKLAGEIGQSDIAFETFLSERNENCFRFSRISETEILYTCRQLKPKLSSGADFISTKLLKEIAPLIITPLHYLINLSLETGFVPSELKLTKIVPVFKDGNCHEFTNYRPISLLSSLSKLFEKIVYKQLYRFLNINEILYTKANFL